MRNHTKTITPTMQGAGLACSVRRMVEPDWTNLMSVAAVVVSLVAIVVSVATGRYLQKRQHRFELLATCLDDLSERKKKVHRLVRWEALGDHDDEDSAWSHYESAAEIYGLMKHHLPDSAALEGRIKRVEDFQSRLRRGERRTPDGDWDLSDALAMEAAMFVGLLKDAVAKALYGTVRHRFAAAESEVAVAWQRRWRRRCDSAVGVNDRRST